MQLLAAWHEFIEASHFLQVRPWKLRAERGNQSLPRCGSRLSIRRHIHESRSSSQRQGHLGIFQPGAAQLKHGSRGRSESHYHRRAEVGAIAVPVCWTVAVQVRPVKLKCFASLGACRAATATIFATFGYALAGFVTISFPLRSLSKPSVHYC